MLKYDFSYNTQGTLPCVSPFGEFYFVIVEGT